MNTTVRTKSIASMSRVGHHRTMVPRPPGWDGDDGQGPRLKLIGREEAHPWVPIPEIAMVPNVIALALAQLIRDRWAAEQRHADAAEGRLRVVVTSR